MAKDAKFYFVDAQWFAAEFAQCFRANQVTAEENNRKTCLKYLRAADRGYSFGPAGIRQMRFVSWLFLVGSFALGQFGLRPLAEGQPAWLLVGLDLVLALNFFVAMVVGLGLARMWLRPKAYVVISEAALEEAFPGLAAKLEERYDMTFLRGLYEDLVAAAKKHPVV